MENDSLELSFANLYQQYLACRRNKRNTLNALKFEAEQEKKLLALTESLQNRTYQPGRSVCFFATRPKLREIFAADFQDRVVHHLLVDYLERIYEPIFIHDSYACRKGKGIHAGVSRLQTFLRKVTRNGTCPAWYLQLDIHNYFMQIDQTILHELISKRIKDETALWLCKLLIFHDCTQSPIMKGNPALKDAVPDHKTLFKTALNKGLPIGNLNSQFFANVYLNELDQFIKHQLRCRYYLRYCDDLVLLANSPEQLADWKEAIAQFLQQHLQLQLNPRQLLAPVHHGINFLGYIVRRDYKLVRRRVVNHLKEKLAPFENQLVEHKAQRMIYHFRQELLEQLHATLSSYMGHLKWANSHRLKESIWGKFPLLAIYFEQEDGKLILRSKTPANFQRLKQQYLYFRWRFPEAIVLMEVGNSYRVMHSKDHWITAVCRCQLLKDESLLLLAPLSEALSALVDLGISILVVSQLDTQAGKVRKRVVCDLVVPSR